MNFESNCVVRTLAEIMDRPAAEIVAEISKYSNHKGGPAFTPDGGCALWAYGQFLESLGWTWRHCQIDGIEIPSTALIEVEGHVFGLLRGRLIDTFECADYSLGEICGVWTPPSEAVR